ncbi:MAG: UDP-2,3-diacylglucosamine diphosphatase [Gammaproteobacteria bacterium]|nr:UDP-2,3-diacylglucosamine diphosphatase [Gammaproteobacteria bacterium]
MTALFLSDLHIDETVPHVRAGLERVLSEAADVVDDIYILGDLVEVWVGDDDDAVSARELRSALKAASEHSRVHVMHGNRDFLLGERFAEETGVTLLPDPTCVEIGERRVLLAHGDAYCTGDLEYQAMRRMFRSPDWQRSVLARPLAERRQLAQGLRAQSVAAGANKAEGIMDVTAEAVTEAMAEHNAGLLVHGHTHRPAIHELGDGKRRIVLGDWGRCGWTLHLGEDPSDDRLLCFGLS